MKTKSLPFLATITNPALDESLQEYLPDGGSIGFFQAFLPSLITLLFVGGTLVFLAMLLLGGIAWISAGGDKGKVEEARTRITNAIIGILVLFTVYAIVQVLQTFFGITILTLDIGVLKIE